jgi:hypothetical protein
MKPEIDKVRTTIAEVRRLHPELRMPATWTTVRRVFQREGIMLIRQRGLKSRAQAFFELGVAVISIDSGETNARELARLAAHEYGHVRMHFDANGPSIPMPARRGSRAELEADLFADLLLRGAHAASLSELAAVAGRTL